MKVAFSRSARSVLVASLVLGTTVVGRGFAAREGEAATAVVIDGSVYLAPQYLGFSPPASGSTYIDPVFGTTIRRVSNALAQRSADSGANLQFIVNEYSSMSPFNSDNTRMLVIFQSYFVLFDGNGNFVQECPLEINASSEPRWSRADPNVLYFVRGNQLKSYNASTGSISVVRAFGEYSSISGKGESDICFDGNHFVFIGNNREIFVYDVAAGKKGPVLKTGGRGIDNIAITPNDNVTVTWLSVGTSRHNGIELFDRNMNFKRQLSPAGGHMDVTRDVDGEEVLILINAADPKPICNNAVVKVRLSDGQKTCLVSLDWSLAAHISAPDRSGSVFLETYAPSDPTSTPAWTKYTNEILEVKLDGSEVRRLAHHRSRPFNSYNYQPRVSVSRDGSRVLYSSNFGLQATLGYPTEYSDVYLLTVPAGGSSGGGGTGGTGGTSTTFIQENAPAVTYTGTWFNNALAGHNGGTAKLAAEAGSRATLSFTGTQVRWFGYRDEWSGIANVYIDGEWRGSVDTYVAPHQFSVPLYTATGLASGTHTIAIEASGRRGAGSAGEWVWIDGFEINGSVADGTGGTTVARTEESGTGVVYDGLWFKNATAPHSGGQAMLSMDVPSSVTFTFNGTGVRWIGYRDEWSGIATVSVDGGPVESVDTYASPQIAAATIWSKTGLAAGTHTVKISVTGTKTAASAGLWIWIDAFDVIP